MVQLLNFACSHRSHSYCWVPQEVVESLETPLMHHNIDGKTLYKNSLKTQLWGPLTNWKFEPTPTLEWREVNFLEYLGQETLGSHAISSPTKIPTHYSHSASTSWHTICMLYEFFPFLPMTYIQFIYLRHCSSTLYINFYAQWRSLRWQPLCELCTMRTITAGMRNYTTLCCHSAKGREIRLGW